MDLYAKALELFPGIPEEFYFLYGIIMFFEIIAIFLVLLLPVLFLIYIFKK